MYGVPQNIEGETLLASPDETTKLRLMFNMKYLVNSSDTIYHANYDIDDSFAENWYICINNIIAISIDRDVG